MTRRVNLSRLKSQLRQIEQKQRQAVNNYNTAARRFNAAVTNYNREARAHNARVRANQRRLRHELVKLRSRPSVTTRHIAYRASVETLHRSFIRVEVASHRGGWSGSDELLDLFERETANSIAALNTLADAPVSEQVDDPTLRETAITNELVSIDPDLNARWAGALYALNPRNPDAARHFCTSSREILARIVDSAASDAEVIAADPSAELTPDGTVSRRARIKHCLRRRGTYEAELVDFVETDIDDVVILFTEFNQGTHGSAGRFSISQLRALKERVEHAIQFLHRSLADVGRA
jgi:hypothetical protein